MRDNLLVNLTGVDGHSMAIDINMEHAIGQVKVRRDSSQLHYPIYNNVFWKELLTAKGLEYTWDRLGDISAAIDYLNKVKRQVSSVMNLTYQNKGHNEVNTSHLVWEVAKKVREDELQLYREERLGNATVKSVVDTLASGEAKLKSSTLKTFNRKVADVVAGKVIELNEVDTIPSLALNVSHTNESMEGELDEANDT